MRLLDIAITFAKYKKLIFGLSIISAAIAAAISLLIPNIYTGIVKILPPQQNQSSAASALLGAFGQMSGLPTLTGLVGIKNPSELYVAMLKSRTVADRLIARFDLKTLYEARTMQDARNLLSGNTTIVLGKEGLITLEFDDRDPKRAAAIANAYVEELDQLMQGLAISEASQRRLFFEKQLKSARENLSDAEVALRKTQEETGLIKLDDQGRAIIESVARLRAEIAAKEVQLSAMRLFATDKNPELVLLQQQITALKGELSKLESTSRAGRGNILVPTGRVPELGLEYLRKYRDMKYHEVMFEVLSKQYELARIDEAKDAAIIQVVDTAIEPERKSKPKRTAIVVLTSLVFFLFSIILALFMEAADRVRQDPEYDKRLRLLNQELWSL